MTRTLQEGVLSASCHFQYADGALQPRHKWNQIYDFRRLPPKIDVEQRYIKRLKVKWNTFIGRLYTSMRLKNSSLSRQPELPPTHQKYLLNLLQSHITASLRQGCLDALRSSWTSAYGRDMLGQASSTSSVEQLSAIWNALVFRSTTKKEDLPAILANLLDFNAHQILSQEPRKGTTEADKSLEGNVMRAILWSLGEIPLSLLYNAGPRVRADEPHKNRWIPLAPAETTISAEPALKVDKDGFSVDSHTADKAKHKTQLCFVQTPPGNVDELAVTVQNNSRYRIKFLKAPGDTFDRVILKEHVFYLRSPKPPLAEKAPAYAYPQSARSLTHRRTHMRDKLTRL